MPRVSYPRWDWNRRPLVSGFLLGKKPCLFSGAKMVVVSFFRECIFGWVLVFFKGKQSFGWLVGFWPKIPCWLVGC